MSGNPFLSLKDQKYISLKTFYENGRGVATPVEFAEKDGKLYVNTRTNSWKVKRIQGNPKATIAPCTIRGKLLGEEMDVTVKILFKDPEKVIAEQALDDKFNKGFNKFMRLLFVFFGKLRFWKTPEERIFLKISV
ncbi:MAG: PPOX class F420-dependent oxidoreductase [Promethearchaeota archaeon]